MSPLGNAAAQWTSLSGDGRYLAFGSYASDLVPGHIDFQLYVFDRQACTFERVSVNSAGEQSSGGRAYGPSISDDGRYVAFYSTAGNLVSGDTNNGYDVFVRDRQAGTTTRVSVDSSGNEANGDSTVPAISGNGQVVAFVSSAANLVAGDTNGATDIFVRDLAANTTTRVSVATGGGQASGGSGTEVTAFYVPSLALSNDGRYVFFSSAKADLVTGDTNGANDVFRHDRQTGTTIRVSVGSGGTQADSFSIGPAASGDGRYAAFTSNATNLVASDTNGYSDVFVHDITTGVTTRASVIAHGGQLFNGSINASISGDGRYVAFESGEDRLVPDDENGFEDVFVRDRQTATTRRVSVSAGGGDGNSSSTWPSLSDDGTVVAYFSLASNLVPDDTNGAHDVFVTFWQALPAPASPNRITNGDFSTGLAPWTTYAEPNSGDIVWNTDGGVLQFYRKAGSTQAVVLQDTPAWFLPNTPLVARFDIGNSSALRKRVSVLVHQQTFRDLHVCTFWLEPNAPMRTYTMRTHTTAIQRPLEPLRTSISFYAATADGTGFYQVDNVSLMFDVTGSDLKTECEDPTTPAPPGGAPSGNLVSNGDFSGGLPPWGTYGSLVWQIAGGVFEFYRPAPPPTPAGVVLQDTGQAMAAGDIMTASFALGNSSSVRKRVTLLLHEGNFSDLSACTFWIPPGAPLMPYSARMFTTKAWTNATLSMYAATIGSEPWIRFDDVVLQRTPAASILGTECLEPVPSPEFTPLRTTDTGVSGVRPILVGVGGYGPSAGGSRAAGARRPVPASDGRPFQSGATGSPPSAREPRAGALTPITAPEVAGLARVPGTDGVANPAALLADSRTVSLGVLDLRTGSAQLTVQVELGAIGSAAELQLSSDGETWTTVALASADADWTTMTVDLTPFAGQLVYWRLLLDARR